MNNEKEQIYKDPERGSSTCQGPEAGNRAARPRKRNEAGVFGACWEKEVRELGRGQLMRPSSGPVGARTWEVSESHGKPLEGVMKLWRDRLHFRSLKDYSGCLVEKLDL